MLEDEKYMREALREAEKAASKGEVPVGAVVVTNRGNIIARTHNLTQTLKDVTAHAEIQAITAASMYLDGKYLKDCTIYITLEPCAMCAGALGWSQIGRIVYAADEPRRGFTKFSDKILHPKTIVQKGILAEESLYILKTFFKSMR